MDFSLIVGCVLPMHLPKRFLNDLSRRCQNVQNVSETFINKKNFLLKTYLLRCQIRFFPCPLKTSKHMLTRRPNQIFSHRYLMAIGARAEAPL